LPTWVAQFNGKNPARSFAGQAWEPLLTDPGAYPEPDSVRYEANGIDITFPHRFRADSDTTALYLRFTPFVDQLTAALALEGVRQLGLGRGPATDVLAVSFSATDYVGHFYGPESKEQHDQILRLDRVLGGLLDTLFRLRDSTRIVIAMTADHGGGMLPELHGKLRVDFDPLVAATKKRVQGSGGEASAVEFESGALFVDPKKLGGTLTVDQVTTSFIEQARQLPGVLRVDRFAELAAVDTTKDYLARRWLHMFAPDLAPTAVVTLEEGNVFRLATSPYPYPIQATHGSPHNQDSHVPIILVGAPFKPGRYSRPVRTVDIAPTLARVLGVTPTEPLDGRSLVDAIR
jgi:hypothetical protein